MASSRVWRQAYFFRSMVCSGVTGMPSFFRRDSWVSGYVKEAEPER